MEGSYVCLFDGEGVLNFEKDAEEVGFDRARREYSVKITPRSRKVAFTETLHERTVWNNREIDRVYKYTGMAWLVVYPCILTSCPQRWPSRPHHGDQPVESHP